MLYKYKVYIIYYIKYKSYIINMNFSSKTFYFNLLDEVGGRYIIV